MHALALYLCNIASEEDQEKLISLYWIPCGMP